VGEISKQISRTGRNRGKGGEKGEGRRGEVSCKKEKRKKPGRETALHNTNKKKKKKKKGTMTTDYQEVKMNKKSKREKKH